MRLSQVPAIVHIVDDDEAFRTSTGRLLRACGYTVETHGSAARFLEHPPDDGGPSCILLDIRIPGLSGPELQQRLSARGSNLPIIFLSGHADVRTTVEVIKAGADDLLTKPVNKDELIGAIERATASSRALQEKDRRRASLQMLVDSLTPRERQVLDRVVRGKTNKAIGRELGATERTIKAHRSNITRKLETTSVAELVLIAERLRLFSEERVEIMERKPASEARGPAERWP
jgi:FixJ family two-component response regulator